MNILLGISLGLASTLDLKYRRIPNWLTLAIAIIFITFNSVTLGFDGFIHSVTGLLAGIALLWIPFALGGMGGGDVKLLGAIGAGIGPVAVLHVFLWSAVFGAIFSIVESIRQKRLKTTLKNVKERLLLILLRQKFVAEKDVQCSQKPIYIPYAISLSLGTILVHYFGGGGLWTF